MILDVLIFTLGLLVAGLLALAALPAVWRRALRLSGERLSRLVPLSAGEIAAERDHLRAAHAVDLRRAEQRLERAEAERAALRVEAGRRETRILALDGENARAQVAVAGLDAQLAGLRREVDGLRAEIGAEAIALHGLSVLAENRLLAIAELQGERALLRGERAALRAERDGLVQEVDRGRGSLAGLETRLIGADTSNEDLRRELECARRDAATAAERLAAVAAPRDDLRALLEARTREVEGLTAELAFMTEQAASAERRTTEAIKAHEALRAEGALRAEQSGTHPHGLPPAGDEATRLRAAIMALAEEVMRAGRPL